MKTNNQPSQQPPSPIHSATGILKQWDPVRRYGIIYAPEGKRYFLHISSVIEGTPELSRRVSFEIGEGRTPTELKKALNARVGETVGAQ